jgi:MoaA/NifB/PqqE/SkfB family radical SAM enzyme
MNQRLYNQVSTFKLEYSDNHINNRAKLNTGTHCNYNCGFCYYKTQLDVVTDFNIIKDRIDYLVECGIKEVDLSGGESSIHKKWFDILDYCKSKGLYVSCLSNGFKFAKKEFIKKSYDHGLREILFSVHGYDSDSHNELVGRGNAYKNIIKAINNAHELDILVRVNCTVTPSNYNHLDQFVDLMNNLNPCQVNFLPLNYWDDAKLLVALDYKEASPYIHMAIDTLNIEEINVRYIPFCFMEGYEKYVVGYYQHIYDLKDWNIAVYDHTIDPKEYKKDPLKALYASAEENRLDTYTKPKSCMSCKYFFICDGIESENNSILPNAIKGEVIYNPMHYRKGYYETI